MNNLKNLSLKKVIYLQLLLKFSIKNALITNIKLSIALIIFFKIINL